MRKSENTCGIKPSRRRTSGTAAKKVAICLRLATASHRRRLSGIFSRFEDGAPWDILLVNGEKMLGELLETDDPEDRPDGIISCTIADERVRRMVLTSGIPYVGIGTYSGTETHEKFPVAEGCASRVRYVRNDDEGVGASAAKYFMSLGNFRSFAYVHASRACSWSETRGRSFIQTLAAAGRECAEYGPDMHPARDRLELGQFLARLEKPAAVLAAWDGRAAEVLDVAKSSGVAVPAQMVILGVDDDETFCEHAAPPLSSVRTNAEGMGRAAADALNMLMQAKPSQAPETVSCSVLGITERASTHPPAPAAHIVEQALAYIEAHAKEGIGPGDVARHLNISRRLLDMRFHEYNALTVSGAIVAHRLEEAKRLLTKTTMPAKAVFAAVGFSDTAHTHRLFKKATGVAPGEWRRRSRADEASGGEGMDGFSRLWTIKAKDADRLRALSLQLTPDAKFSIGALSKALRSGTTRLFVLRHRGMIVACASAVFFDTPTARHCRIEDVVVDSGLRGSGLGRQIMEKTLAALRQDGVRNVELTSRPARKAANALYRSLGFALRKTNVYALDLQAK